MRSQLHLPLILIFIIALLFILPSSIQAAGMLDRGANGGSAPFLLSLNTKGVAFLLIWLIEAIVFWKMLKTTLIRAIIGSFALNAFSTFAGMMLSAVAFSMVLMTWLCLGGYILLTLRVFAVQDNLPCGFSFTLIGSAVIGSIFVYSTANVIPPINPFFVYIMMLIPMMLGFGISVMLESYFIGWVMKSEYTWRALMAANVLSFIMLGFMVPFFQHNVYADSDDRMETVISEMIINNSDPSEFTPLLTHYAANNFFLMGFSKDPSPPGEYYPGTELDILNVAYNKEQDIYPRPETGLALVEHLLAYPELFEDPKEDLIWAKEYFEHWIIIRRHTHHEVYEDYRNVMDEFDTWFRASSVPYDFEDFPDNKRVVEYEQIMLTP